MRDLLTDPAWAPEDLGMPLPDSPHAVSVAMPCWQDVIDYEEDRPRVAEALRTGYPRFFLHRGVSALFEAVAAKRGRPGECSLVFPNAAAAERCRAFTAARTGVEARLEPLSSGAVAVLLPESARRTARLFWRFGGETVSSRMAGRLLAALESGTAPALPDGTAANTVRARLAGLAGVSPDDVFLFTSGMAAIAALHRTLESLHPGKPSVQLDFPYVDALKVQEEFGCGVHFLPVANDEALAEVNALARAGSISAVFCEIPGNPLLRSVRAGRFATALREHGIPLFIDDTIAGVTNVDALRFADAVTTSLTKAFSGAGDVMAGAVTLNPRSPLYETLQRHLRAAVPGHSLLWPEDAVVLERNSRDFPERAARMSASAAVLAAWLERHPAVEAVYYPRDGDGFEEIARPGAGRGCLLSFVLQNPERAPAVYDHLRISKGPSLGTNFSLCCPYTLLAHYTELEWAARCGVRADLIRISAGLEEPGDLIRRLSEALAFA